jgi:hypothetical protein
MCDNWLIVESGIKQPNPKCNLGIDISNSLHFKQNVMILIYGMNLCLQKIFCFCMKLKK